MSFAFKFYKRAAELDCKEAIFKLGYFFENGIETEKNIQLAIRKYEEAAAYVINIYYLTFYRIMSKL